MKKRDIQDLDHGDLLTKMEVCDLFCKKLRISRDTYYKHIRPRLTFKSISFVLHGYRSSPKGVERMPYSIAIGIINKITGQMHEDDPPDYKLQDYYDRRL